MLHIYAIKYGSLSKYDHLFELVHSQTFKNFRLGDCLSPTILTIDPVRHLPFAESILSPEEIKRALGFYRLNDRKNFIFCHAILRLVLSFYLGEDSVNINYRINRFGKPYLKNSQSICFSLSYGANMQCIAISDVDVGIDLQYPVELIDVKGISARFYTDKEKELIDHSDNQDQLVLFYQIWTRKEALLKALGLSLDKLREINVLESFLGVRSFGNDYRTYHLKSLPNLEGHYLAIARHLKNSPI